MYIVAMSSAYEPAETMAVAEEGSPWTSTSSRSKQPIGLLRWTRRSRLLPRARDSGAAMVFCGGGRPDRLRAVLAWPAPAPALTDVCTPPLSSSATWWRG